MRSGITGEVLIADNGSTDGSQRIAETHGARVVPVPEQGLRRALLRRHSAPRAVATSSWAIPTTATISAGSTRFVEKLRAGYQLVMGNRFLGGIAPGAMPPLHRYLGNPVLSALGRCSSSSPCGDFHCGLRGFERDAILALDLQAPGMEFASEMVVKATIARLRIAEVADDAVAATAAPARRICGAGATAGGTCASCCCSARAGCSCYPGIALFRRRAGDDGVAVAGATRGVAGVTLDIHTLFYAAIAIVVGFHSMLFWVFAKVYGMREGIAPPDPRFTAMTRRVTLEAGLIVGGAACCCLASASVSTPSAHGAASGSACCHRNARCAWSFRPAR